MSDELDVHIRQRFNAVGVRFFHAENLHNFAVYCRERALVARSELQRLSQGYTRFYSDESDEQRGALSRIFGNIFDFGVYMKYGRGIPNIYGPISLAFRSTCFVDMSDIVITPVSIASLTEQKWRPSAPSSPLQIDQLSSGLPRHGYVRQNWLHAELSCSESRLSFDLLDAVVVEPITVNGQRLRDIVRSELRFAGIRGVPVTERVYERLENEPALGALVRFCERLPEQLTDESPLFASARELGEFSDRQPNVRNRLGLWARYFYFGTVKELQDRERRFEEMIEAAEASDTREPCEQCAPGERSPAMVTFGPLHIDGIVSNTLEAGICDWCNATSVRCFNCGSCTPIASGAGRNEIECDGGCGVKFAATHTNDEDGSTVEVEMLNGIAPNELDDTLTSIVQATYEDDFSQAIADDEYPVTDIELDQLVISLDPTAGVGSIEWDFSASHYKEDGIGFGGTATASISFNAAAVDEEALEQSVKVTNIRVHFALDDDPPG